MALISALNALDEINPIQFMVVQDARVESGVLLLSLDYKLRSPCQDFTGGDQSSHKVKSTAYKALYENCKRVFEKEVEPAFDELASATQYSYHTRTPRALPLIPIALSMAFTAIGGAGATAYSELAEGSSNNRLNRMESANKVRDFKDILRDEAIRKLETALTNTINELTMAKETRTTTLQSLGNITTKVEGNRLAVLLTAQLTADVSWESAGLVNLMSRDKINLQLLASAARKRKLATRALFELTGLPILKDVEDKYTRVSNIKLINTNTIRISAQIPLEYKDSSIVEVIPFTHYVNYTTSATMVEYCGPRYALWNETSKCLVATELEQRNYNKCTEPNYRDPRLDIWKRVPEERAEEARKPKVIKTATEAMIYCMFHKIHIDGRERSCPPTPFRLDLTIPFTLDSISHQVEKEERYIDGQVLELQRNIDDTKPDAAYEREMEIILAALEKERKALTPGIFGFKQNTLTIPMPENSWLIIAVMASVVIIAIGGVVWINRPNVTTTKKVEPTIAPKPEASSNDTTTTIIYNSPPPFYPPVGDQTYRMMKLGTYHQPDITPALVSNHIYEAIEDRPRDSRV